MDLLETVGARMVLIGQREYVAALDQAQKATADLGASAKTVVAASAEMNAATVQVQATQRELAAAMQVATNAQREYNLAVKAAALAEAEAAGESEVFIAAKRAEAEAAVAAAAAIRDAALVEVQAQAQVAAAAATSAAEVEAAEASKVAATTAGSRAIKAAALGVTAVAAVVAVASVKMAGDFERATNLLVVSAGESKANIDMVREGIVSMAGEVGYSAEKLADAMLLVERGGQHGADGLKVLQAAAEGAKAENSDLTVVADAVTSVLVDYHLKAEDAATVTSKLVAATASGKTTFEELAGSMAAILPIASANHVSLDDILGDLASMTVHGMSAQQASQNLSDVIKHMAAPTSVQAKELATLGINAQQLSSDLGTKGLSGVLIDVTKRIQEGMGPGATKVIVDLQNALKGLPPEVQALGKQVLDGSISMKDFTKSAKGLDPIAAQQAKSFATLAGSFYQIGTQQMTGQQAMQSYTDAVRRATGDATGLNVALMLTGENTEVTTGAIHNVAGATAEAGNHVLGWSEIQETFNQKLDRAGAGLGALAIAIGTYLLPPLTVLVGWIADAATWMAQHQAVAIGLAVVIGVVLVGALAMLTVQFYLWAASILAVEVAGAPLILIIVAVIAVVAALAAAAYFIVDNWSAISGWFAGLWNDIKIIFNVALSWILGIANDVANAIVAGWNGVMGFFETIGAGIGVALGAIGTAATWLWQNVLSPVFSAIGVAVRILIAVIWTILVTPFVIAWNILSQIVMAVWNNSIKPGFEGMGMAATWLWQNAILPAWNGIMFIIGGFVNWLNSTVIAPVKLGLQLLGLGFTIFWQTQVVPVWNGIMNAIGTAWNWINTNVFAPIKLGVQLIGLGFQFFWQTQVVPVWQGIQNAISTAWNWINSNVFVPLKLGIQLLGIGFQTFWQGVIVPVWAGIQSAISTSWQWIKTNVFDNVGSALDVVGQAFDKAWQFIAQVWDKVRNAVATPIHWVVDTVYTHGIKAVWDGVADFVGLGHLPDAPAFAGGGVLGGYAPGRDTVPALLSPGEAVLVPELVQAIGPQTILALNAAASGGRAATVVGEFAGGGVVGTPAPIAGGTPAADQGILGWLGSVVGSIGDFLGDPVGKIKSWLGGVIDGAKGAAATPIAKMLVGLPAKALDALVQKITDWWQAQQAAAAAAGPVGAAPAAAGGNVGLVQAMAAARGWTGAEWNALYAVVMRESGFNNNAQNPTSTAYGMFQFLDSTWGAYGASKTSDPAAQTTAGLNYIASRYGSPSGALAHEQQYGWYSGGGYVEPRASGGPIQPGRPYLVGERGPELIIPDRGGFVIPNGDTGAGAPGPPGPAGRSFGGTTVNVQAGAVVIYEAHDPQATYEAVKQGISDAVARR